MQFTDKAYDILKWVALIVLPGLGVLYSALASLWGWPYLEEVPGTTQAIALFLGALIGISTAEYRKNND